MATKRFIVLEKAVGQTPLDAVSAWRLQHPEIGTTPLAYAGRLDPMASGKLLILIGDECKRQEQYHDLDKAYEFEILLGATSDSGDVLGLISAAPKAGYTEAQVQAACNQLVGSVELPYPKFSSKTVQGKPLHTWTMEGRLDEIEIPHKQSTVYQLQLTSLRAVRGSDVFAYASSKIELIPPVIDERKALGNDFRRPEVRQSWKDFGRQHSQSQFQIARVSCIASSGTYMRTLAHEVAKNLSTVGLAYSIHRTEIGRYKQLPLLGGMWVKRY